MPREKSVEALVLITIRLRAKDVEKARSVARQMAIPYQHVIRGWVGQGASRSQRRAAPLQGKHRHG